MNPLARVYAALEDADCHPRGPVYKFAARCPVTGHGKGRGDRHPSLSVREGADQRVLVYCFAGCSAEEIVRAIGLTMADLFPRGHNRGGRGGKPLPAPRPEHEPGPLGMASCYLSALALSGERVTLSIGSRCPACGGEGAWLRGNGNGLSLDCPEGCDSGAMYSALAMAVRDAS